MAEQIFEQNARSESDAIERATREAEQTFTADCLADMEARDAADLEDDEVSGLDLAAVRGERIETLAKALRAAWRERDALKAGVSNVLAGLHLARYETGAIARAAVQQAVYQLERLQ